MLKKHSFWLLLNVIFLLLTTGIHSMSLINEPVASNETESTLFALMKNYQFDLCGSSRSMSDLMLFFNIGFTLLLIYGALINLILLVRKPELRLLKSFALVNLFIFGACFVSMLLLTFLIPVVCLGLVFTSQLIAYIAIPKTK